MKNTILLWGKLLLVTSLHRTAYAQTFTAGPNGLTISGMSTSSFAYVEVFASAGRCICRANLDGSVWLNGGAITPADVMMFVHEWFDEINSPVPTTRAADWNQDGRIAPDDIAAFVSEWNGGCAETDQWLMGGTHEPCLAEPISISAGTIVSPPQWYGRWYPSLGIWAAEYSRCVLIASPQGHMTFSFTRPVEINYPLTVPILPPPPAPAIDRAIVQLRIPGDVNKPTPYWLVNGVHPWRP